MSAYASHDSSLAGQVAIVTGAGRGLGRAIATRLATAGAHVAVAARTADQIDETVSLIHGSGGRATGFSLDVSDNDAVQQMVAQGRRRCRTGRSARQQRSRDRSSRSRMGGGPGRVVAADGDQPPRQLPLRPFCPGRDDSTRSRPHREHCQWSRDRVAALPVRLRGEQGGADPPLRRAGHADREAWGHRLRHRSGLDVNVDDRLPWAVLPAAISDDASADSQGDRRAELAQADRCADGERRLSRTPVE